MFTLGNRYPNGDFWQNRSQPWGNSPPGLAGVLLVGDNGIETKSTQVLLSAEKPFTEESRWGATFAYTFTDAEHNRDINEHYLFDAVVDQCVSRSSCRTPRPNIAWSPRARTRRRGDSCSRASSPGRHRFRATSFGCLTGPATFPTGAPCTPWRYDIGGTGYQSLDLQITKNFEIGDFASMYLRLDVLNVTNEHNLVDYIDVNGPDGVITGGALQPDRQHHRLAAHDARVVRREVLTSSPALTAIGC